MEKQIMLNEIGFFFVAKEIKPLKCQPYNLAVAAVIR